MRRALFVSLLSAAAVVLAALPAYAAPIYSSSDPDAGAQLHEAPQQVSVTFSEPLDPASTLLVRDECGRQIDDGQVEVQIDTMTVGIKATPSGRYEVSYVAEGIAGVTGQTEDSFAFDVHGGSPCGASSRGGHQGHGGSGSGGDGRHEGAHGGDEGTDHDSRDSMSETHPASHDDLGQGDKSQGHRRHGDHRAGDASDGDRGVSAASRDTDTRPLASGQQDPIGDGLAALTAALALAAAFGALGGLYLRVLDPS